MSRRRPLRSPALTLEALSEQVDTPRSEVLGFALLDLLGPVRTHKGTLLVRPTEWQLDRLFPEHARKRVAEKHGWPLDDTIGLRWARQEFGDRAAAKAARKRAPEGGPGLVRDARGWGYVRLANVDKTKNGSPLTAALRNAPKEIRELARYYWFPEPSAVARAHLSWDDLQALVPTFQRTDSRGRTKRYAWLGPQALAAIERASLETAVRRLEQAGLSADDFVPRRTAITHLAARHGIPTEGWWIRAAKAGHIIEVRAAGFSRGRHQQALVYSHVPQDVWNAEDPRLIKAWLNGIGESARQNVVARASRQATLQRAKRLKE